jgi:hypothetical protein
VILAAMFATMITWWNLGMPRLAFSPELAPIHDRIKARHAGSGSCQRQVTGSDRAAHESSRAPADPLDSNLHRESECGTPASLTYSSAADSFSS